MNNRYSLANYPETYETFGSITELKQVVMTREVRKLRELVREKFPAHFAHESYWWDGRNYYLMLEPYLEDDPESIPELAWIRIPLAVAPYHNSRPKPEGFTPPKGVWLISLSEAKSVLEEIQGELEVSAELGLYGL